MSITLNELLLGNDMKFSFDRFKEAIAMLVVLAIVLVFGITWMLFCIHISCGTFWGFLMFVSPLILLLIAIHSFEEETNGEK